VEEVPLFSCEKFRSSEFQDGVFLVRCASNISMNFKTSDFIYRLKLALRRKKKCFLKKKKKKRKEEEKKESVEPGMQRE